MGEADKLSPENTVYRRIPEKSGWVKHGKVDPAAFLPNKYDTAGGISLVITDSAREAAASGRRGKKYYAVPIRVGSMSTNGLIVVKDGSNHAYIDGWVYEKRNELRGPAEFLSLQRYPRSTRHYRPR